MLFESDEEFQARRAEERAEDQAERDEEREKQALLDAESEEEAKQLEIDRRSRNEPPPNFTLFGRRRYNSHPRIHPGQKFFRPADPNDPKSVASAPVTVLSRVQQPSLLTKYVKQKSHKKRNRPLDQIEPAQERQLSYSNGLWNVQCFCGAEYQAKGTDLNRLVPWALHCPDCILPRKRRTANFRSRPGSQRHLHKTYGRLKVMEWIDKAGWLCTCECGTDELVRRSVDLGRLGYKRCPHV